MLNKLKKLIPRKLRIAVLKLRYWGNTYYCNCCKTRLRFFIPGNPAQEVVEKCEIVGAGYLQNDLCPVCKASYRNRSVMVYLDKNNILKNKLKVLHIAPEPCFSYILGNKKHIDYVSGDLEPWRYWYYTKAQKIDILAIDFPDNSFDLILCNHVLEHIEEDAKAMKELFRVLHPEGTAILQVPLSWKLDKSIEDSNITTPEERLKTFGQKDHVRIYGKDYITRLEDNGFRVEIFNPSLAKDFYGNQFEKLELDPRDRIFVCTK